MADAPVPITNPAYSIHQSFNEHTQSVYAVASSGRFAFSAGKENIYVQSGEVVCQQAEAHIQKVWRLALSPTKLASIDCTENVVKL